MTKPRMTAHYCVNCFEPCGGLLCLDCWRMAFISAIASAVVTGIVAWVL